MTWFENLTGFRETVPDEVRRQLVVEGETLRSHANGRSWACGPLETPTLGELRARAAAVLGEDEGGAGGDGDLAGRPGAGGVDPRGGERDADVRVTLREVVADVQALHADPANAGALFQVASQFNLLEMTSPHVTPEQGVGGYEHDRTQGPACAIACGAGTIYRNYFAAVPGAQGAVGQTAERQIDCLADLGAALGNEPGPDGVGRLWTMRNGYALATRGGLFEIGERLAALDEAGRDALRARLRIGLHWDTQVTLGDATHRVSQAYCSALPVAYSPHASTLWEPFARLVLEAAYEATLWAGVVAYGDVESVVDTNDDAVGLHGARAGRGRVYLTLLGGGAFGNEMGWIADALARAVERVRLARHVRGVDAGVELDVAVVSYGRSKAAVREMVERVV